MSGLMLNQREAAVVLGVNPRIVRRWTRRGMLPTFTDPDSRKVLYPLPALERWALEHEFGAVTAHSRGGGGHAR